jgi:aminoglycoside 6'-N-acetyltransferase I
MGIAKKLLTEGEKWIKEKGCTQIGSDAYIDNKLSYDFHTGVGFKEAGKLVAFIKDLK